MHHPKVRPSRTPNLTTLMLRTSNRIGAKVRKRMIKRIQRKIPKRQLKKGERRAKKKKSQTKVILVSLNQRLHYQRNQSPTFLILMMNLPERLGREKLKRRLHQRRVRSKIYL